jgi:uncharacterized membrane protein
MKISEHASRVATGEQTERWIVTREGKMREEVKEMLNKKLTYMLIRIFHCFLLCSICP